MSDQSDGSTYTVRASDSPASGWPIKPQLGTNLDLEYDFRLWLLWRFTQEVNGEPTLVYYPLAKSNWQVVFLAHASTNAGPIDTIDRPKGVTADSGYTRTNVAPDTMSPTTFVNGQPVLNTGNGNNTWVNVN